MQFPWWLPPATPLWQGQRPYRYEEEGSWTCSGECRAQTLPVVSCALKSTGQSPSSTQASE